MICEAKVNRKASVAHVAATGPACDDGHQCEADRAGEQADPRVEERLLEFPREERGTMMEVGGILECLLKTREFPAEQAPLEINVATAATIAPTDSARAPEP